MASLSEEVLRNSKELKKIVHQRFMYLKQQNIQVKDVCELCGIKDVRTVLINWIGTTQRNDPYNTISEKQYLRMLDLLGIKITIQFTKSKDLEKITERIKNELESNTD